VGRTGARRGEGSRRKGIRLSLPNLESFLQAHQTDERLHEFQQPVRGQLDDVRVAYRAFFDTSIPLVRSLGDHLLGVTGKQFRPALVLLVARCAEGTGGRGDRRDEARLRKSARRGEAARGDGPGPERQEESRSPARADDVVFAATIVELIHTATLVHDDTIDKSAVRRGLPTINTMFNDMVATILGDYIYTKAFHELLERGLNALVPAVARTTYRMSIGEMLQLQQKDDLQIGEAQYFELVDEKTASLMGAATEIGALVGGLDRDRCERFRAFGEALGRAYQVTDDLFDYIGDPARIGKGVRTDLPEGKVTLPLIRALAAAGPADRSRLQDIAARRSALQPEDWRELLRIFEQTGAVEACRQTARDLAAESLEWLRDEPDGPARTALSRAVAYAVQRVH